LSKRQFKILETDEVDVSKDRRKIKERERGERERASFKLKNHIVISFCLLTKTNNKTSHLRFKQ